MRQIQDQDKCHKPDRIRLDDPPCLKPPALHPLRCIKLEHIIKDQISRNKEGKRLRILLQGQVPRRRREYPAPESDIPRCHIGKRDHNRIY